MSVKKRKKGSKIILILTVAILIILIVFVVLFIKQKFLGKVIETSDSKTLEANKIYKVYENERENNLGYIIELKDEPVASGKVIDKQKQNTLLKNKHAAFKNDVKKRKPGLEKKIKTEYTKVFNGFFIDTNDESDIEFLKKNVHVKKVYLNRRVNITLMDSVPLINADDVWLMKDAQGRYLTGQGIKIAIIDTGVDYTHTDLGACTTEQFLAGNCAKVKGGFDFVNNDADPIDDQGHGTHVAATAAGNGALKGVAPDAIIYAVKVLDAGGSGSFDQVISGIEWAVDPNRDGVFSDKMDVISMSLGGYGDPDDPGSTATDNAVKAGVVAVVAAGNSGPGEQTIGSPGTARKAITVGASNKSDIIADFSSRGPVIWTDPTNAIKAIIKPDIVAPGVSICAAQWDSAWNDRKCFDDRHVQISGTSMATPHVAGVVALVKQAHSDWTPDEIKMALRNTAKKLTDPSTGQEYDVITQGYGRVDVLGAMKLDQPPKMSWDFYVYSDNPINNIHNKIIIKGIFPDSYKSLFVEYSKKGENNWMSKGIVTVGDEGIVAEFSPEGNILETGDYEFKVRIVKKEIEKTSVTIIYFDKNLKSGWPRDVGFWPRRINSEDIDNDGKNELIIATVDGFLYVFRQNGEFFSLEWPKKIGTSVTSPAMADIDMDRENEIIIAETTNVDATYFPNGRVHVFNSDGSYAEGWPVILDGGIIDQSSVSVGDIDGDGDLEIIIGTGGSYSPAGTTDIIYYKKIYAFHHDGDIVEGWPVESEGQLQPRSTPVLADLDHDGNLEIIVGSKKIDNSGGAIEVFHHNGAKVEGFPYYNDNWNWAIAAGDVNNDGEIEILTTRGDMINRFGKPVLGWQRQLFIISPFALLDGDQNNFLEIFYGGWDGEVHLINHEGNSLPGWPIIITSGLIMGGNPIVGDIDGDNEVEILIGAFEDNKLLYAFNYDGSVVEGFPKKTSSPNRNILMDDLDNDGSSEIVSASGDGTIFVWELNTPYNPSTMEWPMFQHDPQHTGLYTPPPKPIFIDVPFTYWASKEIEAIYKAGITSGCKQDATGKYYCPTENVTRAQIAVFLVRAMKQTEYKPTTPTFVDVPATHPQYGYIEKIYQLGITSGCRYDSKTKKRYYCPNDNITRADTAVFLSRAAGIPTYNPSKPTFADVPRTHYAYQYIEGFYKAGITSGCKTVSGKKYYCLKDAIKRDEMAVFLVRAFKIPI